MPSDVSNFSRSLVDDILSDVRGMVTFPRASEITGVPAKTLRNWMDKGLLRVIRPAGGHPRIPRVELERLLREAAE